jgi:hypothetical protein
MSHADFRPKRRSGVVPSGRPRRKIPLLRILLLLLLAFFVYLKFDSLWTGIRALNPVALWDRAFGGDRVAPDARAHPVWSADSSRFSLECPGGLRGCCDTAPRSGAGVCREAAALLAKARARGLLPPASSATPESPLRLHARAGVSRAAQGFFELTALQGRASGKTGGAFALRKNSAGIWCDARHLCLSRSAPRSPLALGRLLRGPDSLGAARWVSASSAVHPVLSGRIAAIDSVPGGARVRLYHGGELYTSYEPLRFVPAGLRPGAMVTPGSVLGEAPWLAAGYTVYLRVRRAGLNLDPAEFFSIQPVAAAEEADTAAIPDSP